MKWHTASAAELGRGIGAGQIDPVDLTQSFLDRAGANADTLRIYTTLTPDRALSEAKAAATRAKTGTRRGPLDGVPISWKDLFDSAGVETMAGSQLHAGRIPDRDALVLQRATEAGMVCLGKTHLSELAFSGLGVNPMTATSPNVNDPDAVPGGSSSGAAASVAFGLAAAGIGSDTGGSVRLPAAWNDLVGFKTTAGLVPLDGAVKLAPNFDTVGPLTRTVEDAALIHAILAGDSAVDLTGADVANMRFLVLETVALEGCDAVPLAAFEGALERLSEAGAQIIRGTLPEVAEVMTLSAATIVAEAWAECGTLIDSAPDKMFPPVRERFEAGKTVSATDYIRAWDRVRALRLAFNAKIAGFDAVLLPSAAVMPPKTADVLADYDYFTQINLMALRNTRIGNMMGACGITIPTGTPSCGIMAMGAGGTDRKMLRIGAALEAALRP